MNLTIARITARGLFGRRRFLLLLPLPLLLVGLAVLPDSFGAAPRELGPVTVLVGLGFAVVLPVIALIVGTGVLGSGDRRRHAGAHPGQAAAPARDPAE